MRKPSIDSLGADLREDPPSPWDEPEEVQAVEPDTTPTKKTRTQAQPESAAILKEALFDMEGLMTDFPTATDLERFVYDRTGIVLSLKGRANKLKYQVALDVLNGNSVDPAFIGADNPWVEKGDMIPVEELKPVAPRDPTLPPHSEMQNVFFIRTVPHPDATMRAESRKVECLFKKYRNGMISYEVTGPIEPRPQGEKMDKFGRMRPEIIRMIDPRTGEQVIQRENGSLTPRGRNLKALLQNMKANNSTFWDIWVDKDFAQYSDSEINNPWLDT
jgi:hypothetical protein